MNSTGLWKCRSVESQENQPQVFLPFHRPWESLRDSHIPTATTIPISTQRKDPAHHSSPSGSSFDEKMLRVLAARGKNLPKHVTSIVF
jgi:3-mercaptopyruvate sulfurtransferase SseA